MFISAKLLIFSTLYFLCRSCIIIHHAGKYQSAGDNCVKKVAFDLVTHVKPASHCRELRRSRERSLSTRTIISARKQSINYVYDAPHRGEMFGQEGVAGRHVELAENRSDVDVCRMLTRRAPSYTT